MLLFYCLLLYENGAKITTPKMYAVRDLTALDYENCDNILADPLYKRLFCFDSIANLHLECCYACVAV